MRPAASISSFYKYLTAESACAVLRHGSLKWSHPTEFNDPFDCNIDLKFDTDIDADARASLTTIKANSELLNHPSMRKLKLEALRSGTNFDKFVLKSIRKTIENFHIAQSLDKEERISKNQKCLVICFSELNSNKLMWSHYADSHKGALLQFSPKIEDTYLRTAQKVDYVSELTPLRFCNLIGLNTLEIAEKFLDYMLLTKSADWYYESEWRVIAHHIDGETVRKFRPFLPEELDAVYFGANISHDSKNEILTHLKTYYPIARKFQSAINTEDFSMRFEEFI